MIPGVSRLGAHLLPTFSKELCFFVFQDRVIILESNLSIEKMNIIKVADIHCLLRYKYILQGPFCVKSSYTINFLKTMLCDAGISEISM